MAKAQSTELVPVGQYKIATMDPAKLKRLIRDNLGDEGLSVWDLPRIVVPTGGGVFWTVGDEPRQALQGVIVHQRDVRR